MADPVGLVSLGLPVVGKLIKVFLRRRKRTAVVHALAAETDAADLKIRNARGDAEVSRAVLSPLLNDAAILLHRFSARGRLGTLPNAMDDDPEDMDAAKKLVDAFKAADAEIELRNSMLRIGYSVEAGNDATLARIHMLQRDIARLEKTVQKCMVSVVFFVGGGSGVTLHESQKL